MAKASQKTQTRSLEISNESGSEISPEVAMVINELPIEKRKMIIKAITVSKHSSGPLPDGETIKIYNDVIPNGGDRLMSTVEQQLKHRFTLESQSVKRSFNQSSTGQWMGLGVVLFFGFVAWDLAKSDHDAVAGVIGGIDLVGLAIAFLIGRKKN